MRVRGQKSNVRLEFQATTRTTERGRTKRLRPNRYPSVACARPSRASPGVQESGCRSFLSEQKPTYPGRSGNV
jgi:hypothetical protein